MADITLDFETGNTPRDVRNDLGDLESAIKDEESEAVDDGGAGVLDIAERLVAVDTGRTKRSLAKRTLTSGGTYSSYVGSNYEVAKFLEFGTRPHTIGYGLRFRWPNAPASEKAYFMSIGSWPYVMYDTVSHPGTSPQPFLGPAVEAMRAEYRRLIKQAHETAVRDAGGG